MIKLNRINKSYGKNKVLTDFSYDFNNFGLYKIVGNNGSGKTTLLKIIGGQTSYKGKITYNGRTQTKALARKNYSCSLVYNYFLGCHLNSSLNDIIYLLTNIENIDKSKILDLLKKLSLDSLMHETISSLSSGEKKRLVISLTLARDSSTYLLDEPLTHLDNENQILIKNILQDFSKDHLVIYNSHDDINLEKEEKIIDLSNNNSYYDQMLNDHVDVSRSFNIKKEKEYINNKSFPKLLIALFYIVLIVLGGSYGLLSPKIIDYSLVPSKIKSTINCDYSYLDFSKYYSVPNIQSVYSNMKNNSFYPCGMIKSFNYLDEMISIDEFIDNNTSFYPLVLPSTIFDIDASNKFYLTSALYEKLNKKDVYNRFGATSDPITNINIQNLKYGGVINSKELAFIVSPKNIMSVLKISNVINEDSFFGPVYDYETINGEEKLLNRKLNPDEVIVYYDPSISAIIPNSSRQIYFDSTYFKVAGYTKDKTFKNMTIVSSSLDLFDIYCRYNNREYSFTFNFFPLS